MKTVRGWANVYRSGYYHRIGKPTAYDRQLGDLYATEQAAKDDIDPDAAHLYIDTIPVVWIDPENLLEVNPDDSVPVPLSVTKRVMRNAGYTASELFAAVMKWATGEPEPLERRVPSQIEGLRPLVKAEPLMPKDWKPMDLEKSDWSLEVSDGYSGRFDYIDLAEQAALKGHVL